MNSQVERPYTVGLTGGIGSGKSTVCEHFQRLGASIVDADLVAREVVAPGTPGLTALRAHFGEGILQADGTLDRRTLRDRIFQAPGERAWLEALLHPLIRTRMQEQCLTATGPYVILAVPLLLEHNAYDFVDRVLVIDVPESVQRARVMARDGNSAEQVDAIMATQMEREARRAQADDIIDNDQDLKQVQTAIESLHERYCQYAQDHRGGLSHLSPDRALD